MTNGFLGNSFSNIRIDTTKNNDYNINLQISESQNILNFPDNSDILIYTNKNLVEGQPGYWRNFSLSGYIGGLTDRNSFVGTPIWNKLGIDLNSTTDEFNDASTLSNLLNKSLGLTLQQVNDLLTIDESTITGGTTSLFKTVIVRVNTIKNDHDIILSQLYGLTHEDIQNYTDDTSADKVLIFTGLLKEKLDAQTTLNNSILSNYFGTLSTGVDSDTGDPILHTNLQPGIIKSALDSAFTFMVGLNYDDIASNSFSNLNIGASSKLGLFQSDIYTKLDTSFTSIFGLNLTQAAATNPTLTSGVLFDLFKIENDLLTTQRNNLFTQSTDLNTLMNSLFGHSITATAPTTLTTGLFYDAFQTALTDKMNDVDALYTKLEDYTTMDHWTIDTSDATEITSSVNCINIGSVSTGEGDINNKINETMFTILRTKTPYWSNMWTFELNDVDSTDSSYFHFGYKHTSNVNNRKPLTIRYDGKIGINNTMPEHAIHIKDSADVIIRMEADTNDGTGEDDNPQIFMSQDGGAIEFKIGIIGNTNTIYQGSTDNYGYLYGQRGLQLASNGEAKMTFETGNITKFGDEENQFGTGWVTNRHSYKRNQELHNPTHFRGYDSNWDYRNPNDLTYEYYPKQNDIHAGIGYHSQGTWAQPDVIHEIKVPESGGVFWNSSRTKNISHGSAFVIKAGDLLASGDNGTGVDSDCYGYGGDVRLISGCFKIGGNVYKSNSYSHRGGSIRFFIGGNDGGGQNYTSDSEHDKVEKMTLDYKGWLALGKYGSNADAPLEVMHSPYPLTDNANQYTWFSQYSWTAVGDYNHYATPYVTGRFEFGIAAQYYLQRSDERIKTEIELVDDKKALDIINNIESYEYDYKDPSKKNETKTIGFVAQQVKKYLPNAVSYEKNYIPDQLRILENLEWIDEKILVINDLVWNDTDTGKIKFIVCDNPEIETEIEPDTEPKYKNNEIELKLNCIIEDGVKTNKFSFDKKWDHVLIHGKEISDFNIIDKNMIYALHHSAIQELSRENVILKDKVSVLEEQMKNVLNVMLKLEL